MNLFPNEYYKRYVRDIPIYQKPGYVAEALNVDAVVCEEKPYLIALIQQDWEERLQRVMKSVVLVLRKLDNWPMSSMNGIE